MYDFIATVCELAEFKTPPDDLIARLNALIVEDYQTWRSGARRSDVQRQLRL